MIVQESLSARELRTETIATDLVVIGGGLAGTCCALTAAREGIRVVLIQDRPVLGGNGSSEVRLWTLGATAHMGNNNRWAREGGVIDEILVENQWRNPEGNALIFDTVLLEKVLEEPNLTLLLNTAVYEVEKSDSDTLSAVSAFCSQNSTRYVVRAPLFCDASGDGIVGFLSGAAFRMGAEKSEEFGEPFAPSQEYGELLGHSIYFYSKDTGRPVRFIPPSYALTDIEGAVPRFRNFKARESGCRLWWIEYGGRLDTVHDTEKIKWELWRVVYGVWDYIKNSGKFPPEEVANLTLEWVGHIPGKRESRRFEGDYLLTQQDVSGNKRNPDDVAFGGWAIDLHPADGVFSEKPGCTQWQSKRTYGIPYRCYYSRNIRNLFLAGRIISVSHVAFGSTRVMGTGAHGGQAVGTAAALCTREDLLPRDLNAPERMALLQRNLLRRGQYLPEKPLDDPDDLTRTASLTASSTYRLDTLPDDGLVRPLNKARAQLVPVAPGHAPLATFTVDVSAPTTLRFELRCAAKADGHTADVVLAETTVRLETGDNQSVTADFGPIPLDTSCYLFYTLLKSENVSVHSSEQRVTGILSVENRHNQNPPSDIGVESFPFWLPSRRPGGQNLTLSLTPAPDVFEPENIRNGYSRPTSNPNAWVAAVEDPLPTLTLTWPTPQNIKRVVLMFDPDYDHPMESVLMGHPEAAMPFCVRHWRLRDVTGTVLAEETDNHQARREVYLPEGVITNRLTLECVAVHGAGVPVAVFELRCYSD